MLNIMSSSEWESSKLRDALSTKSDCLRPGHNIDSVLVLAFVHKRTEVSVHPHE